MNIGAPGPNYDPREERAFREQVRTEDLRNQKTDTDIRLDAGQRLVIPDEVTGTLYRLKIASGVLSIEAFIG